MKWNILLHVSQEVITGTFFVHVRVYKLFAFEECQRFRIVINERVSQLLLKILNSEVFPSRIDGIRLWSREVPVAAF